MRVDLFCLCAALLISSCGFSAGRYAVSADNVAALRLLEGTFVRIGPFTATNAGQHSVNCRGTGRIQTSDGEPLSEFVRKGFVDELRAANVYSETDGVTITGNLDSIDVSTTRGLWDLAMTVRSSNGTSMSAQESFTFPPAFVGDTACIGAAQALTPAVQNLIGKIVRSQGFTNLVSQQDQRL